MQKNIKKAHSDYIRRSLKSSIIPPYIAMSLERIIVGAIVTSREKPNGKQLPELVKQTRENGIKVAAVGGDRVYSEKDNLKFSELNNIKLISKLSKTVTHGNRQNEDKFDLNIRTV